MRKCNKCQKSFVKEDGCNKMKCSCGNTQCYVCSENITDYMHFDEVLGTCPMYGDMQDRIKKEVAMAQELTVHKLLRDQAELRDHDIRVDKSTTELGRQKVILDLVDKVPLGGLRATVPEFTHERPRTPFPQDPPARRATAPTAPQIPTSPRTTHYEPLRRDVENVPPYRPPYDPWFNFYDNCHLPISPPLQVYDPPTFFEDPVGRSSFSKGESPPCPTMDNYFEDSSPRAEAGPSKRSGNKLKRRNLMNVTDGPGLSRSNTNGAQPINRRTSVSSFVAKMNN